MRPEKVPKGSIEYGALISDQQRQHFGMSKDRTMPMLDVRMLVLYHREASLSPYIPACSKGLPMRDL